MDDDWQNSPLKAIMDERDRRYSSELAAMKEAVRVAEQNAEKWRMNANEWRDAMNDREREFLPRNLGYLFSLVAIIALAMQIYRSITGG